MEDLISRQAAIDIERNATVDTNPSHFEAHQKFEQFMDDAEISSFGRWQWSNGFNTALTAVGIGLEKLPSADRPSGEWFKDDEGSFICSACGSGYKDQPTIMGRPMFEYCPSCGAKMKGADDDE